MKIKLEDPNGEAQNKNPLTFLFEYTRIVSMNASTFPDAIKVEIDSLDQKEIHKIADELWGHVEQSEPKSRHDLIFKAKEYYLKVY